MAQGRKGHIGLAKETTFDVPVAAVRYHRFRNEGVVTAIEEVTPPNILGVFDEGPTYQGLLTHSGPVEFDSHPVIIGDYFLGGIGPVTSTQQTDPATRVWQVDATPGPDVFVDETTDFNSATANDVDPFPATEAVGDYFAIGFTERFNRLQINTGTAGTVGVVIWEYWNGTAWAALAGVVDGTSGFTVSGLQTITFTMPSDWAQNTLSGTLANYIRARVTTVYTINPILTQGFIIVRHQHDFAVRQTQFSDDVVPQPFTWEIHRDLGQAFQYPGGAVSSLQFRYGIGEKVMACQAGIIAKRMIRIAATTPTFETPRAFQWREAAITLPDPTSFLLFQDMTVNVDNGLEGKAFLDGTQTIRRIRASGPRIITVSGTVYGLDPELTEFLNGSERFLKVVFTGGVLGASNYKLEFHMPRFRYTAYPVNIAGADETMVSFAGKAKFDPNVTDTPIKVRLLNSQLAY